MASDPTRDELVQLCTDGVIPQDKWGDRDSSGAQRQLGEARALLAAGCDYQILRRGLESDADTWWVSITWKGFNYFESGDEVAQDRNTFYIPTRFRLDSTNGRDWY